MSQEASDAVRGPAVALKVYAVIGGLLAILGVVTNIMGASFMTMEGMGDQETMQALSGGVIGIVFNLIGMAVCVLIWVAAGKMQRLESSGLVMTASIVAMVPCISPCCLIGLPIGIWALIVLNKPEVKEAFTS